MLFAPGSVSMELLMSITSAPVAIASAMLADEIPPARTRVRAVKHWGLTGAVKLLYTMRQFNRFKVEFPTVGA